MKIGIDASRAFVPLRTGTENYSYNLIQALAKIDKKNQYRLYVRSFQPSAFSSQLASNFEFVPINSPRLWTQLGLAWQVLKNPPDILFIPAHTLPIIRRPNLKTVATIHDLGAEFLSGFHTFPQKLYLNFSTKYAVKHATAIIAVSKTTKQDLIKKLGAAPDKIFVVYEGIDREKFKIINDKLKIERVLKKYKIKTPYILFVGTIQPRKNLERLIEAFSRLSHMAYGKSKHDKRQAIDDMQLVIAGKKGWLYDEILTAPKRFKVEDEVKFLDYVEDDDLPTIYQQAEVFVLPSLVEGFGLPILEAMASRVPVVCSNLSSLPEVAGQAALYFNPENVEQMAATISQILANSKLKKDLVEKGRKQLSKFSWGRTAAQTLSIFERLTSEKFRF